MEKEFVEKLEDIIYELNHKFREYYVVSVEEHATKTNKKIFQYEDEAREYYKKLKKEIESFPEQERDVFIYLDKVTFKQDIEDLESDYIE